MEWLDVLRRIESGESRHTEFKRGLGDLNALGMTICAFANTEGGVLILGVADTREIVGVREDADGVEERLTAFLQTGCSAPVSARIGRHEDPQGRVHWLEIARQRGFEPMRYDGRVWVRRERSSVEPSPTELQELYNTFGYILTEERAIPNHMTPARVRAGANPRARNDAMGHFMAGMGYMERRGRGWLIMRTAMRAFNGTEPELLQDERNRFVRVTFRLAANGA